MKGGGSAATGSRPPRPVESAVRDPAAQLTALQRSGPLPPYRGPLRWPGRPGGQKVRIAISAGAASNPSISGSRRLSVMDVPAMSSEVQ
jgi:hypothetical protein